MDILKIAWRDISSIFKNRFIRVSVIAIIIVPLLYSLLYLAAFWDPYGDLTKMSIAVVNLDKGQKQDGKILNYGKDVIDKLKKNKKVGWKFVSKKEAISGLNGKKYYAEFIIPEDFSKKVTSAKDGKPKQAKIIFISNEKKNFLASQINGKVETMLKEEIANSITKQYAKVTFDNLYDVKEGMYKAANGSKQIVDGIGTAKDGSSQIKDGLTLFNDKIGQASGEMNKYKYLIPLLNEKKLNSVSNIIEDANTLKNVNIDPAMIGMLTKFVSEENAQGVKSTMQHIKNASGILQTPEVKAISDMIAKANFNDAKKMIGDVKTLHKIDMSKVQPVMGLLDNPQNLIAMKQQIDKLQNVDIDKYNKILQLVNLHKNEFNNAVREANDLTKINMEQYKVILGMLNESNINKFNNIMNEGTELSKIDITKFEPMMEVLKNSDKLNGVMSTAEGLTKLDMAPTNEFLNTQKTSAQQFIGAANKLNTKDNLNSLQAAINSNANLDNQKKSQLLQLINGYYGLVDTTKNNMTKANDVINSTIMPNINLLQKAQEQLKDKDMIEAMSAMKKAITPENIQKVTVMMGKLQEIKQSLSDPQIKILMQIVQKSITDGNIQNVTTMIDKFETMKKYLTSEKMTNLMKQVQKSISQSNIDQMIQNMDELKKIQGKLNEPTIKGLMDLENIMYLKNMSTELMSMKSNLDKNIKNIDTLEGIINNFDSNKVKSIKENIEALKSDMIKAKPLVYNIQGLMTPSNIEKLKKSPEVLNHLLSMQNDLKDNKEILEIAEKALNKGNIDKAKKLIEAIPAMTEGVNKLAKGSNDLYNGIIKLHDGSNELNDKLTDGANQINKNLINSSNDMGEFISKPVTIKNDPINPVHRYGEGFAPYFMPLSLWVGAIMMFFVITQKVDNDLNAKNYSIVTGKFLSYGFIGVLQAVLVSIAIMALGLRPTNVILYFAVNIFMSYVFIAIIQSLVFLLGDPGRLLAIILLLLQLTSCSGTFPVELVPKFFQTVNPFLPFTYGIEALREVSFSTNINYTLLGKDLTVLACMLVGFLTISILMKKHADNIQEIIQEKIKKAA